MPDLSSALSFAMVRTCRLRTCLSAALVATWAVSAAAAQAASDPVLVAVPRLTVRPRQMATGTRTARAGLTELAGFPGYQLYVPTQCVGTRRSPLIVLLHGGGGSAGFESARFRGLADQYDVIVLYPNASDPGRWDLIYGGGQRAVTYTALGLQVSAFPTRDLGLIDSAMNLVLRTEAIDPNRIALMGFSDGGSTALLLGRSNQDVFSRVVALSALDPFDGPGPTRPATQFFLAGGIAEDMVAQTLKMAHVLRHDGHPVVTLLGLRGHVDRVVDEDFIWRWLLQSWADPSITLHPPLPADSDPVLTVNAIQQMTTFWTRFRQEPDAVLGAGRMAHQEQLWLALGTEPASVITTDMPALAAAYPSVAADLEAAGLTAQQEQAYRAAILRVGFARIGGIAPGDAIRPLVLGRDLPFVPIAPTSVLGQNLAFRQTHAALFKALAQTGMWTIQ